MNANRPLQLFLLTWLAAAVLPGTAQTRAAVVALPSLRGAIPADPARIEAAKARIRDVERELARVDAVPTEFAGVLIVVGLGEEAHGWSAQQLLAALSARQRKLESGLAAARRRLAEARAGTGVAAELREASRAIAYVEAERVSLLEAGVADARADIRYVQDNVSVTGADRIVFGTDLIARKRTFLRATLAFLKAEKALLEGRDPRPRP